MGSDVGQVDIDNVICCGPCGCCGLDGYADGGSDGPGLTDTGTDTGVDTGTDTGVDTGTDTGVDTGTDTGVDTGTTPG